MDIIGLDIIAIGAKMLPYLTDYFTGSTIALATNEALFQESFIFHYDEIEWMLPKNKVYSTLNKDANYNGASGFLYFTYKVNEIENIEYTALLLSNEDYSKALLLCVQAETADSGEVNIIVVKDFLVDSERSIEKRVLPTIIVILASYYERTHKHGRK